LGFGVVDLSMVPNGIRPLSQDFSFGNGPFLRRNGFGFVSVLVWVGYLGSDGLNYAGSNNPHIE
jgi:hypothetical protein